MRRVSYVVAEVTPTSVLARRVEDVEKVSVRDDAGGFYGV